MRRVKDNSTALHQAAWYGHADVLKLLLSFGADKTSTNQDGDTPLQCAQCAQQEYDRGEFQFPADPATCRRANEDRQKGPGLRRVDFQTRDGWPSWDRVIQLLSDGAGQEGQGGQSSVATSSEDANTASSAVITPDQASTGNTEKEEDFE